MVTKKKEHYSIIVNIDLLYNDIFLNVICISDAKKEAKWKSLLQKSASKELRKDRQTTPNRYCSCSNLTCNCCRDFSLPVVPVSGPGLFNITVVFSYFASVR